MKPSQSIKPISFLKTNTADVIRDVNENRETIIIKDRAETHLNRACRDPNGGWQWVD